MSDFPPGGTPPPPPPGGGLPPPPPTWQGTTEQYGYGQPVGGGARTDYASFGSRLGALIIDAIIVSLFFVPAIVTLVAGPTELEPCRVEEGEIDPFSDEPVNAICEGPTNGTWAAAIALGGIALIGGFLYHTLMVGKSGQTIGKRVAGVRVIDANNGGVIGNGRAFGRYLFQSLISGNVCFLGYLWMLWDERKQTWHDKVVNSIVVRA
jgi:uncharacterized RDD family membrane protein YckC